MSDFYQHPLYRALFAAVCESWQDMLPRLVLHDWLLEQGEGLAAVEILSLWQRIWVYDIDRFSGSGIGSGNGSGSGSGSGSGIGSGIGSGNGSGRGSEPYRVKQMRIGQAYLVHCGDWHTYVGRVVAQTSPGTYEMKLVSKIHDTNGQDCWEELAAGDEQVRRRATYRHYKTTAVIPLVIAAFEWVGQLPQEAGY